MARTIRLLGLPSIEFDGRPAPSPRGRKAWALLAYLVLSEQPPSRRQLASLLFEEADDPLGALRWNLAELRRVLGDRQALRGDPPLLVLDPGDRVDAADLLTATPADPGTIERLGRELLEGADFPTSPAFEAWLTVERQRLSAAAEAVVHEAALASLARDDVDQALGLAARLIEINPLDDANQELLVRCLARAGDHEAANEQVAACEELFRRELGVPPSPAVRRAAEPVDLRIAAIPSAAAATAQLEAGTAALSVGAVDEGLAALRRACAEARRCGDDRLRGRALVALGSALFHTMRASNEEAATYLHEAVRAAHGSGARDTAVSAHRQLAFIDARAGRPHRARRSLEQAKDLAVSDDEHAGILLVRGMLDSDTAHYPESLASLAEADQRARSANEPRLSAFALSLSARTYLVRGDLGAASITIDESLAAVRRVDWLTFLPWPETVRADIDLQTGALDRATATAQHALALACHVQDPCWEGLATRVLARITDQRGDHEAAWERISEALTRVTRAADPYPWATAQVLDTMCELSVPRWPARAQRSIDRLATLAARHELRELTARSLLHRGRLGDAAATSAAATLIGEIDNPVLHRMLRAYAGA